MRLNQIVAALIVMIAGCETSPDESGDSSGPVVSDSVPAIATESNPKETPSENQSAEKTAAEKVEPKRTSDFDYSFMLEYQKKACSLLAADDVEKVLGLSAGSISVEQKTYGDCYYFWTAADGMSAMLRLQIIQAQSSDFEREKESHLDSIESGLQSLVGENHASYDDYLVFVQHKQRLVVWTRKGKVGVMIGFTGGATSRARFKDATDEQFAHRQEEAIKVAKYLMDHRR